MLTIDPKPRIWGFDGAGDRRERAGQGRRRHPGNGVKSHATLTRPRREWRPKSNFISIRFLCKVTGIDRIFALFHRERRPAGQWHQLKVWGKHKSISISIHSPHAGRDGMLFRDRGCDVRISIHSPHAGRDFVSASYQDDDGISIHSPHAGRDKSCLAQ